MNDKPSLDELIGGDVTAAERERLQHVHDLLLRAGPPPELTPELEAGPTLALTLQPRRRPIKPRALMLLAAALVVSLVFFAGYIVANGGGSASSTGTKPVRELALAGTPAAPHAQGVLQIWRSKAGNWPMSLSVAGLPKLPPHTYYEVYLVRGGKPWGSCGTFRVEGPSTGTVKVMLTAPYSLHRGDSWVVTRAGRGGVEPGRTVLQPVTA